jgi:sigma-E factor negative regulatory protein RseA
MTARPLQRTGDDGLREELSCLLDGELDSARCRPCLDALCGDDAARADWALWHAVGDALRSSEVAALHAGGFGERLGRALAAEPPIVAPRAWALRTRTVRRVVLPGAAAAAAVVVLAVVALPMIRASAPATPVGTTELARATPPAPAAPSPVAVREATPVAVVDRTPQLDPYLQAHREMSGGMGLPRTTHYLRQASAAASDR